MAASKCGGLSKSSRVPMDQEKQSGPWWQPPIQPRCLISPPGIWSPICLPSEMMWKPPHSRQLIWQRSSGSTDYAPGLSRITNTSNTPSVGPSIRCVMTPPCGDTGSWSAALSPFAGITSVNSKRVREKRFPSRLRQPRSQRLVVLRQALGRGKKISAATIRRLQVSWPRALRAVRAWLEPWIMLRRYWRAWSEQPPPGPLQGLFEAVAHGQPLFLYCTR